MSFRKSLVVKRRGQGSYQAGVYEDGDIVEIGIFASVQPLNAQETLLLPENRRERNSFKLFTDTQLFATEKGSVNADLVVINGFDYEVMTVSIWQNNVIPHYKVIVSKRTTNDGS
jgi:hypothetical protein